MDRAVPAITFIAASMSFEFRSGILVSAILLGFAAGGSSSPAAAADLGIMSSGRGGRNADASRVERAKPGKALPLISRQSAGWLAQCLSGALRRGPQRAFPISRSLCDRDEPVQVREIQTLKLLDEIFFNDTIRTSE